MTNLIVDIGNTRIKTARFEGEALVDENWFVALDEVIAYSNLHPFKNAIVSSVALHEEDLREKLKFPFLYLSKETPVPIKNLYATPNTLGVDRKAAVIGARTKFEDGPIMAIDMGSCITYDLLDEDNRFFGGAISPGISMRFKSMHSLTARLPLASLEQGKAPEIIGNDTIRGLQSGVYNGILFELKGYIKNYQRQYGDLRVIICGGDSIFFESLTKDSIFVIPNLVLFGLNRILRYNVN
jgi:type III pantothenate kinase